jgi:hypothetical protein
MDDFEPSPDKRQDFHRAASLASAGQHPAAAVYRCAMYQPRAASNP